MSEKDEHQLHGEVCCFAENEDHDHGNGHEHHHGHGHDHGHEHGCGCGCGHDHGHGDEEDGKKAWIVLAISTVLFLSGWLVGKFFSLPEDGCGGAAAAAPGTEGSR